MRTIGHEELKQKLDRQDHFRLVMALSEWAYQAKHIPGSIHFATMREALLALLLKRDTLPIAPSFRRARQLIARSAAPGT